MVLEAMRRPGGMGSGPKLRLSQHGEEQAGEEITEEGEAVELAPDRQLTEGEGQCHAGTGACHCRGGVWQAGGDASGPPGAAAQEPRFLRLGLLAHESILPEKERWSALLPSEFLAAPDSG